MADVVNNDIEKVKEVAVHAYEAAKEYVGEWLPGSVVGYMSGYSLLFGSCLQCQDSTRDDTLLFHFRARAQDRLLTLSCFSQIEYYLIDIAFSRTRKLKPDSVVGCRMYGFPTHQLFHY